MMIDNAHVMIVDDAAIAEYRMTFKIMPRMVSYRHGFRQIISVVCHYIFMSIP